MYTKHAEFKAGIVVLLGITGLLVLAWLAGGSESLWGKWRYAKIRFEQGFVSPKVGDAVLMNGTEIGRVTQVILEEEVRGAPGGPPLTDLDRLRKGLGPDEAGLFRELYILAEVKMPSSQDVPAGTSAQIEEKLTGTRKLHLLPGTSGRNLTDADMAKTPIPGTVTPGLGDISKKIDSLLDQVGGVVAQGGEVMTEAKGFLLLLKEKIGAINTAEMDEGARAALASLRRTLEKIEGRIDTIGGNLEDASADVKKLASQAVRTFERIDGDVAEAMISFKSALKNLDGIMADARGPVREILGDLKTTARNAADVTGEFAGVGPEARKLIGTLGVDLEMLMRNLIDTSRNLQDVSEDVRAHPWKLMNKPEKEEIAFENLRAAALNYMRAMRDLNDTSRRLTGLMARPDANTPAVQALLAKAVQELQAAQTRYRRDEGRWQQLFREASPSRGARRGGK